MEIKEIVELEIVIKKSSLGYVVYRKHQHDLIDIFPNTEEGKERLLNFVKQELSNG